MEFIQYYNKNKDKIYSYFYYNLSWNIDLAEDLTSDTFLRWFEKFHLYNDKYQFSTRIFTIAKNLLFDYYKKNKNNLSLDDLLELNLKDFASYEINFSENIDTKDTIIDFNKALEKLNPSQKEVIVMKYIKDYSTKEISELTWKTDVNIRKILSRWIKRLKNILSKKNDYEKIQF